MDSEAASVDFEAAVTDIEAAVVDSEAGERDYEMTGGTTIAFVEAADLFDLFGLLAAGNSKFLAADVNSEASGADTGSPGADEPPGADTEAAAVNSLATIILTLRVNTPKRNLVIYTIRIIHCPKFWTCEKSMITFLFNVISVAIITSNEAPLDIIVIFRDFLHKKFNISNILNYLLPGRFL